MDTLANHRIYGISSMLRDLRCLGPHPERLEQAIVRAQYPLQPALLHDAQVCSRSDLRIQVGDVVLFRLRHAAASYGDMEALWGERVALVPGNTYVGVICNRQSSKLITAQWPTEGLPADHTADVQLVAQAGGIGYASGFSPALRKETGDGRAADVEILGAVMHPDHPDTPINTIRDTKLLTDDPSVALLPQVLCIGTATDVGKTTAVRALVAALSRHFTCAAVKASGTAWYEDTQFHLDGGAVYGANFASVGLPTTYNVPADVYLERVTRLLRAMSHPEGAAPALLPPDRRHTHQATADLLVIEHGGDLIEAGIPAYLGSPHLMSSVKAIVICSESAIALKGALAELARHRSAMPDDLQVFANMPLVNPQGFWCRLEDVLADQHLHGVVDVNKPQLSDSRSQRLGYAAAYDQIMSPVELANHLAETTLGLLASN